MKETTESRAVKIAAQMIMAAGLCRYDNPAKCRKTYVDDGVCEKCIRKWLMKKAQKELEKGIGR